VIPSPGRRAWIGGDLVTMDMGRPRATALVERDGLIEYVGDDRGALELAGPGAAIRDLGGLAVAPGFNDNHVHAVFMGDHAIMPDLGGLGPEAIIELLKERYANLKPGQAVFAAGWDYPSWKHQESKGSPRKSACSWEPCLM